MLRYNITITTTPIKTLFMSGILDGNMNLSHGKWQSHFLITNIVQYEQYHVKFIWAYTVMLLLIYEYVNCCLLQNVKQYFTFQVFMCGTTEFKIKISNKKQVIYLSPSFSIPMAYECDTKVKFEYLPHVQFTPDLFHN